MRSPALVLEAVPEIAGKNDGKYPGKDVARWKDRCRIPPEPPAFPCGGARIHGNPDERSRLSCIVSYLFAVKTGKNRDGSSQVSPDLRIFPVRGARQQQLQTDHRLHPIMYRLHPVVSQDEDKDNGYGCADTSASGGLQNAKIPRIRKQDGKKEPCRLYQKQKKEYHKGRALKFQKLPEKKETVSLLRLAIVV